MTRRIFIAINPPDDIKNRLVKYCEKWPDLPIKWTKKENLHITLAFLGYVKDEDLAKIIQDTIKVAKSHSMFNIELTKIGYGPKEEIPKMLWASGENNPELAEISGEQKFYPHITLGRIKQMEWRQIEPEERPDVDIDIDLSFTADRIDIMESELKRGGPTYTILESIELK